MTNSPSPAIPRGKLRITSYAEANEILRSPAFVAGLTEEESLPFRGTTLLELNGEEHRQRRRVERPLVVHDALERYESEILAPTIERCLAEAGPWTGPDGIVRADLVRMSHSMFVQIAAALIGFDVVDNPERTKRLEECMYSLNAAFDVKYSTREHTEIIAEGLAPKRRLIDEFYRPAVERRVQPLASQSDVPSDLLTIMMTHHNSEWDDDLPVRESILFLAGSTSTTSNAVNHTIVKVRRWLAHHPVDPMQLNSPEFLRGVCNEALRLRQNVTALVRCAATDVTLSTGRLFPRDTFTAIDLVAANRDRTVFGGDTMRSTHVGGCHPQSAPTAWPLGLVDTNASACRSSPPLPASRLKEARATVPCSGSSAPSSMSGSNSIPTTHLHIYQPPSLSSPLCQSCSRSSTSLTNGSGASTSPRPCESGRTAENGRVRALRATVTRRELSAAFLGRRRRRRRLR